MSKAFSIIGIAYGFTTTEYCCLHSRTMCQSLGFCVPPKMLAESNSSLFDHQAIAPSSTICPQLVQIHMCCSIGSIFFRVSMIFKPLTDLSLILSYVGSILNYVNNIPTNFYRIFLVFPHAKHQINDNRNKLT